MLMLRTECQKELLTLIFLDMILYICIKEEGFSLKQRLKTKKFQKEIFIECKVTSKKSEKLQNVSSVFRDKKKEKNVY